jgi:outer membrane protein insertion porin family
VNVLVEEKATGSVGVGMGFSSIDRSSDSSPSNNRTSISSIHGTSLGAVSASHELRLGRLERSEASISLTEPWFLDRQLALGTELFYKQSDVLQRFLEQTNVGMAVSLRKPLGAKSSIRGEYRGKCGDRFGSGWLRL